jgi:flagellin
MGFLLSLFETEGVRVMGLRINTNLASIAAQRQISLSQRQTEGNMKSLASGNKFDNPSESSAEYAIAEQLRGQIAGVKAGRVNAENAQSFVQIAEGGLNEQNNILIRMRELAVQAASDTFSETERELVNKEFEQLQQEVDRIAKTTQFGSTRLLAGDTKEYEFQVGAYGTSENIIKYKSDTDTQSSALNVDSLDVTSKSDARESIQTLDEALTKIAEARAGFGAIQSRLESTVNHAGVQAENLEAAHSRLADTNIAQSVSDMYRAQAMQQYQISVLNEANRFPGNVIRLIA